MTPLERLRLATALCHAVPASELLLHTCADETIVVGDHADADITRCAMRRVVRAFATSERTDHSHRVVAAECGGALCDLGGGVFRVEHDGIEQRWIASLLGPVLLAEVVDGIDAERGRDHAIHARVKPDPELGVSLLVISADDARDIDVLGELATQAAATIFVEEMCRTALHRTSGDQVEPRPMHVRREEAG